jgi:N-methylhydantoinase A
MTDDRIAKPVRRLRIGIDTGGTFTDVVAFDELTGEVTVTKTPSTPADPAQGFGTGLTKILGLLGADPSEIASVSHGTTIATNQLLAGDIGRLGFVTTEGYEFLLEIARQSVPDGYGNSYFWVKPDRAARPGQGGGGPAGPHRHGAAPVRRGTGNPGGPVVPRPRH